MQMDELETFITLVEEKNFTRTAAKRSISQPTVSVQIKNLEREFSVSFFNRTTKHLSLTTEGELFYEQALKIRQLYLNLHETFQLKQETAGMIKIGASFTIGEYVLPSVIAALRRRYPRLDFHIVINNTDAIIQAVRRFEVDIGLVEGHSHAKDVTQVPFKADRLLIVKSPSDRRLYKSANDLHNQAWVIREDGSGTRRSFDHLVETNHIPIASTLVISSTQGIKESVKNGLGLALLSEAAIQEELKVGTLETIHIEGIDEKRSFSYVLSKGTSSTNNMNLFITELKKG